MSRAERLLLLVLLAGVLALLGRADLVPAAVGAVAGAVPAVAVAGRLRRLSGRMDARLGTVEQVPRGVRPRVLVLRAGLHLAGLGALLLSTVVVPFIGDELFLAAAAAATGFVAVLTAAGLRR